MPRKILCEKCSSSLNVPDHVTAGKRLKCPKCEFRFVLTFADASSESTFAGPLDADTASLPALPIHYAPPASGGAIPVPAGRFTPPSVPKRSGPVSPIDGIPVARADGDLREAFDLPLSDARTMERGQVSDGGGMADAAALLEERPVANRRQTAADARASARRCKRCGGGIPKGMSLCGTCGLDQESGQVIDFDEDLMPKTAPRSSAPPIHVSIFGGVCAVASLILAIAGLVQSGQSPEPLYHYGWLIVAGVAGFAVYASIQFLRGKTAKVLILALTCGVMINVFGFMVMPLAVPWLTDREQIVQNVDSSEPDTSNKAIKPVEELLDLDKVKWGVALAIAYAGASVYLMSTPVKKWIISQAPRDGV